ncbi:hypothetical protein SpCBS45565_g06053 [Spizellomyces sp. 'palustris']|nr:hypothetical protein SpCBS45565_g06053 [Spizellomyces sp. 'palustris']
MAGRASASSLESHLTQVEHTFQAETDYRSGYFEPLITLLSLNADNAEHSDHLTSLARNNAVTIAATCAAVTSVVCGFPFDSIKTRMQAFRFPSTLACVKTTYNNEGIAGFFRGVVPVAASISVLRSLSFSLYNSGKREVLALLPDDTSPLSALMVSSSASGAFAGSVVATLNAPIDFIKLQKQLERIVATSKPHLSTEMVEEAVASSPTAAAGLGEGASAAAAAAAAQAAEASRETSRGPTPHSSHSTSTAATPSVSRSPPIPRTGVPMAVVPTAAKEFKTMSTLEWAKRIVELKGPTGLYAGYSMHLLRDAIGTAMYFCGYETCKYLLTSEGHQAGPLTHMMAGGLAGSLSWIVLFPIDM